MFNLEGYKKEILDSTPEEPQLLDKLVVYWDQAFNAVVSGKKDKQLYALEFTSINSFCNSRIQLDPNWILLDDDLVELKKIYKPFKLCNIVEALLTELLFFGTIETREKELGKLEELIKEIDFNEENKEGEVDV